MSKSKDPLAGLFGDPREKAKPERRAKPFVLTPNDIERVEACEYSRVFVGPREPMHSGMWFGIFVHRFLEYCVTQGRVQALDYIARKNNRLLATMNRIDTSIIPQHSIPEMTFAINTHAGTADAIESDMAEPETHITCRSDLVFMNDEKGVWEVWDYKTGNKGDTYEKVVAKGNSQLLTAAVGLSLMHDVDVVRGAIVTIDSASGQLIPDYTLYKKKTLRRHFERMRIAHLLTLETRADFLDNGIEPDVAPSPERCRGCRAKLVCHGAILQLGR